MYKRILMPTDGSKCSERAIAEGLELVKNMNAEVTFLYAIENPSPRFAVPAMVGLYQDMKNDASNALQHATKLAFEVGINSNQLLLENSNPVDAIHNAAKDHDLIVMGTHGRRGFDRFLLGSVTDGVLKRITKPCLIIPYQETNAI